MYDCRRSLRLYGHLKWGYALRQWEKLRSLESHCTGLYPIIIYTLASSPQHQKARMSKIVMLGNYIYIVKYIVKYNWHNLALHG